ncbi:hypothetical protein QVD17_02343 [Tagetes erecta]|uniref:Uncharacterized protein n=1 Tax=Tagetes erecta TaxID=13708 RepID=A0AAD8P911_TARER|nr:hypothetical protein QVD17_02343 [Tagetes erecta]
MSKASSRNKQQQSLTHSNKTTIHPNDSDDILIDDTGVDIDGVTSHIYLKPTHATGTLDKQAVLWRIRHRKRMNKVKSTINSLFASTTTTGTSSINKIRWVDDPFTAP